MDFLIQPLEMEWDLVDLMVTNTYCPSNNKAQCGCTLSNRNGCGCQTQ
jgi:hypothetical protein